MKKALQKTKKGAASFYIVAFSTLILVIIAASFATAVINEITRTSNDDLSQSAYDSALAGIEDAKLAYMNYQRCLEAGYKNGKTPTPGGDVTCEEIIYFMKNPDCYMVGHILGRIGKTDKEEVKIVETNTKHNKKDNNLEQAYTCVMIQTELNDYRATLSSSNNSKVVKVDLPDGGDVTASDIKSVKVKWFSRTDQISDFNYSNLINNPSVKIGQKNYNWRVAFMPTDNVKTAVPPVVSVQMVQTSKSFSINDLTQVVKTGSETGAGNKTDRATIVFVPTNETNKADASKYGTSGSCDYCDSDNQWWGAYDTNKEENYIKSRWLVDTNLAGTGYNSGRNLPYLVYCSDDSSSEFACEVTIDLPGPIGGDQRAEDTFMFVISLPYSQPDTEFAIEFYCDGNRTCNTGASGSINNEEAKNLVTLSGVEINVDSTGRANNLYRRVETRLESSNMGFSYPLYGIQLLGDKTETLMNKDMSGVVKEYSQDTYQQYLDNVHNRLK